MQGRDVAIVVGIVVLVVLLFGGLGGGMMGFGGMMGPGLAFGFGGLLMMVFWVLVIGGIVLLIVWAVGQGVRAAPGGARREDAALDILKQRYARGEITQEQFDQMRRDLE